MFGSIKKGIKHIKSRGKGGSMDTKKVISRILLAAGILILIILLTTIDFKIGLGNLQKLGSMLFVLIGLVFLNIIIKAWRWKVILRRITNINVPLWFSLQAIIAGVAAGSFIPGRIELAKPLLMKNHHDIKISHSLAALGMERILELFSLLLIALAALRFMPAQKFLPGEIMGISILFLVIGTMIFVFFPKILTIISSRIIKIIPLSEKIKIKSQEVIQFIVEGFVVLKDKTFLGGIVFLSLLANSIEVMRFYLLLNALGIDASWSIAGFVFAGSVIIGVLTMIPGGIGITELSAVGILKALAGSNEDVLKTAVLIDRFIAYYLLLLLGGGILVFLSKKQKELKSSDDPNP